MKKNFYYVTGFIGFTFATALIACGDPHLESKKPESKSVAKAADKASEASPTAEAEKKKQEDAAKIAEQKKTEEKKLAELAKIETNEIVFKSSTLDYKIKVKGLVTKQAEKKTVTTFSVVINEKPFDIATEQDLTTGNAQQSLSIGFNEGEFALITTKCELTSCQRFMAEISFYTSAWQDATEAPKTQIGLLWDDKNNKRILVLDSDFKKLVELDSNNDKK